MVKMKKVKLKIIFKTLKFSIEADSKGKKTNKSSSKNPSVDYKV